MTLDFEVLIEKKNGKWSKRLDAIMPFFKGLSKIFMAMTWSIKVADFVPALIGLFIKAIAPYLNSEL